VPASACNIRFTPSPPPPKGRTFFSISTRASAGIAEKFVTSASKHEFQSHDEKQDTDLENCGSRGNPALPVRNGRGANASGHGSPGRRNDIRSSRQSPSPRQRRLPRGIPGRVPRRLRSRAARTVRIRRRPACCRRKQGSQRQDDLRTPLHAPPRRRVPPRIHLPDQPLRAGQQHGRAAHRPLALGTPPLLVPVPPGIAPRPDLRRRLSGHRGRLLRLRKPRSRPTSSREPASPASAPGCRSTTSGISAFRSAGSPTTRRPTGST